MMNYESFRLHRLPDGGIGLNFRFRNINATVRLSPDEIQQIQKLVAKAHRYLHASDQDLHAMHVEQHRKMHEAVMGALYRRLSKKVPSDIMGAAAEADLILRDDFGQRPVAPTRRSAIPSRESARARATQATRRRPRRPVAPQRSELPSRESARARATQATRRFAEPSADLEEPLEEQGVPKGRRRRKEPEQESLEEQGVPRGRRRKEPEQEPLEEQGVPKGRRRKKQIVSPAKHAAVKQGLKTIASRAAYSIALQRGKSSASRIDMHAGKTFAKGFAASNGIPVTTEPSPFWAQPLEIIAAKVAAVVKLAETKGAPTKESARKKAQELIDQKELAVAQAAEEMRKKKGMERAQKEAEAAARKASKEAQKAAKLEAAQAKAAIVRRGLEVLTKRRARILASQRGATFPSSADIQKGKNFAREHFVSQRIPIRAPGKKSVLYGIGENEVDAASVFWSQPESVIEAAVDMALKSAPLDAPPPPPQRSGAIPDRKPYVSPPVPEEMLPVPGLPDESSYVPPDLATQMPGVNENYAPGDIDYPYVPGETPGGYVPGAVEEPVTSYDSPYDTDYAQYPPEAPYGPYASNPYDPYGAPPPYYPRYQPPATPQYADTPYDPGYEALYGPRYNPY